MIHTFNANYVKEKIIYIYSIKNNFMKIVILLWLVLISCFCYGQKKYAKPQVDTIRVKKDSVDKEIKNGSLTFFKSCEWTMDMNVNGQGVSASTDIYGLVNMAKHYGKRGVYIYNIKKKNPDGTYKFLPSKQIIIE